MNCNLIDNQQFKAQFVFTAKFESLSSLAVQCLTARKRCKIIIINIHLIENEKKEKKIKVQGKGSTRTKGITESR